MDIEINERLINFLIFLPLFFISLAVHEFSHAFVANKLGDSTAKDLGRLTLNPVKHIDIFGSLVMPLISFMSGYFIIGWAKPVPVNRNNFHNQLKDDAVVSAAGPLSNLALSIIFLIFSVFIREIELVSSGILQNIFWMGVVFNVFLCLFNLLPIPPLDGSHILFDIFPNRFTAKILKAGLYGPILLLLFLYSPLWKYFIYLLNNILNIYRQV